MKTVFCSLLLVLLTASVTSKTIDKDREALETVRALINNVETKLETGAEKSEGLKEEFEKFVSNVSYLLGPLPDPVMDFIEALMTLLNILESSVTGKKPIITSSKDLNTEVEKAETSDVEIDIPGFLKTATNKLQNWINHADEKTR